MLCLDIHSYCTMIVLYLVFHAQLTDELDLPYLVFHAQLTDELCDLLDDGQVV